MKQFFKFMFASVLGCMISGVILFLIAIGIVASLAALTDPPTVVKPNSVLIINLDGPITERTSKDPFATGGFGGFQTNPGLNDILNNIQKAATDPNIKGILLESTIVPASFTTLSEIRRELARFRESGKFLIAYGDYYPQNTYYLASVAERVYVHPEGDVSLRGLHLQMVFLKGLLEKLDIETQVIRYGKYKSAAEPLTREDLSMENRLQITEYANTLWNGIKTDIADSRGITAEEVNRLAEGFLIVDPKKALEYKLVDGLKYRDEVLTDLRQRLGIAQDAEINKIELAKYTKAPVIRDNPRLSRNKVAVIYAQGNIVTGEGDEQIIGSDCISKAIREAREDKDVKAIVLRINSGGGSALASDVILREVMLARQEKPIVASMGAMAASGGYYIASRATKIIANPSTLTGSIGVIGLIPNMENFFNNKLGIAFDDVKTNTYADFPPVDRAMRPDEIKIMENMVDRIYTTFITHVAEARGLTTAQVDEIGQGRIWSGVDAKRIGLIDDLGGLEDAIRIAAELAGVGEDFRVTELPVQKELIELLLEDFQGGMVQRVIENKLGENYRFYQYLQNAASFRGIQARIPFEIEIN